MGKRQTQGGRSIEERTWLLKTEIDSPLLQERCGVEQATGMEKKTDEMDVLIEEFAKEAKKATKKGGDEKEKSGLCYNIWTIFGGLYLVKVKIQANRQNVTRY